MCLSICVLFAAATVGTHAHNVGNLSRPFGPTKLENFGYMAQGYNIYYGNPETTEAGVDAGFTKYAGSRIYQMTYDSNVLSGDGRHLLPDGFGAEVDSGCALSFHSSNTFKTSDYTNALDVAVTADFSGFGAKFSASTDYKTFHERTTSKKERMVRSIATCSTYHATVNAYAKPAFDTNFNAGLKSLPTSYGDGGKYFDFFDNFGTHAVRAATLGSKFGFSSYFSEASWKDVEKSGISVSVAASYEGIVKAGGSVKTSTQKTAQSTFDSKQDNFQIVSLGQKPVSGDPVKWAQQVIQEPMPIAYTLEPICDMIPSSMAAAQANCKKALGAKEYCTKRLMGERHALSTCHAASDATCAWDSDCNSNDLACVNGRCEKGMYGGFSKLGYSLDASRCLEGNAPGGSWSGYPVMNSCSPLGAGQQWLFFDQGGGWFLMKTALLQKQGNYCLQVTSSTTAGGHKVYQMKMEPCLADGDSKQLWTWSNRGSKLGNKYAGAPWCVEGNKPVSGSTLGGVAFLELCQAKSGQVFHHSPDMNEVFV